MFTKEDLIKVIGDIEKPEIINFLYVYIARLMENEKGQA